MFQNWSTLRKLLFLKIILDAQKKQKQKQEQEQNTQEQDTKTTTGE